MKAQSCFYFTSCFHLVKINLSAARVSPRTHSFAFSIKVSYLLAGWGQRAQNVAGWQWNLTVTPHGFIPERVFPEGCVQHMPKSLPLNLHFQHHLGNVSIALWCLKFKRCTVSRHLSSYPALIHPCCPVLRGLDLTGKNIHSQIFTCESETKFSSIHSLG